MLLFILQKSKKVQIGSEISWSLFAMGGQKMPKQKHFVDRAARIKMENEKRR